MHSRRTNTLGSPTRPKGSFLRGRFGGRVRSGALLFALVAVAGLATLTQIASGAGARASARQSSAAASAGKPTFIFIAFFATNCSFCVTVENGARAAAKQLGVNVHIVEPGDVTAAVQNPAMLAAISAHPAGIAFPYFSKANQSVVLDALNAKIPVVLYNNNRFEEIGTDPTTETTNPAITSLPYVGQNELTSGGVLAKAMLPYLKKGGTYVIFDPAPTSTVNTLRGNAIAAYLKANGMTPVQLDGTLDITQNIPIITAYLTAHPNVDGIFGSGDPTGEAAAAVVQKLHLHLPVATIDVDSQAIADIKNGSITEALNQQPYLQGWGAVWDLYVKVVLGLNPVDINTGTQIVSKANVGELAASVAAGRN